MTSRHIRLKDGQRVVAVAQYEDRSVAPAFISQAGEVTSVGLSGEAAEALTLLLVNPGAGEKGMPPKFMTPPARAEWRVVEPKPAGRDGRRA